ncbi:MAG: alginate lyase family protein [Terriglobia bacterium]
MAKEAIWRVEKRQRRKGFPKLIAEAGCPVRLRSISYYRPTLFACSDEARTALVQAANEACQGRFPLLSYENLVLGFPPPWHADFVSGKGWDLSPSDELAYVRHDGSDVKAAWELSRLQFLPVLGKAYRLTSDERYREAAMRLTTDWLERNPVGQGVNWTCPMEAALRAMSILFLLNLFWPLRPEERGWLERVTLGLWQHLLYIESHLEFSYISRSNHYLSDIVGLYCLSAFLEGKEAETRRELYRSRVEQEILHQVYEDGGDYEASLGYHVLVTQLFTTAMLVMRAEGVSPDPAFTSRLHRMYELMATASDEMGRLPHVGDCDDGRVELLMDDLEQMSMPPQCRHSLVIGGLLGIGRALFAQPWLGRHDDALWYGLPDPLEGSSPEPRQVGITVFRQSGIAVARRRDAEVLFFAMPNGIHGKGSHTHNDKLSVVLRVAGAELFCESGTGCYTRDVHLRNEFRSTKAHNTVMVKDREQNTIPMGKGSAFSCGNEARVSPLAWETNNGSWGLRASHSGYRRIGVTHSRTLLWNDGSYITIEDEFAGAGGCTIEAHYHLDPSWKVVGIECSNGSARCLLQGIKTVEVRFEGQEGLAVESVPVKISRLYGVLLPAERICVRMGGTLPFALRSIVRWEG